MDDQRIEFNLVGNALDSIERAVEVLAWKGHVGIESRLKQAILYIAHAVELLLKERLRRIHPSLVWEDVDKYPKLDARTVGADKALSRLRQIGNVRISEADARIVKSIRATRNAIEHFEWRISVREANTIIAQGLSFAISFAKNELSTDIAWRFKDDDTWDQLLKEHAAFAKEHAERVLASLGAEVAPLQECSFCHAMAQDMITGACNLCGHWERTYSFDDEIPF